MYSNLKNDTLLDIYALLAFDLKIPKKCCRNMSTCRFTCLVQNDWMNAVNDLTVSGEDRYSALSETELQLILGASYSQIPASWQRLSIKVITKTHGAVLSLVDGPLCSRQHGLQSVDASCKTTPKMWIDTEALHRYKSAVHGLQTEPPHLSTIDFNVLIRQTLRRRFNCDITPIGAMHKTQGTTDYMLPLSDKIGVVLSAADMILESNRAFYIVQPCHQYTLHDLVTFSPAVVEKNHEIPLFLFYQILQAILCSHRLGLSAGKLRLRDFATDDKNWISLTSLDVGAMFCKIEEDGSAKNADVKHLKSCASSMGHSQNFTNYSTEDLPSVTQKWVTKELSNFDYLMLLNHLAGRTAGDPNHHPILPWVSDFTSRDGAYRDLSTSKFRLNKGDNQLDLTYNPVCYDSADNSLDGLINDQRQIPHHITDFLSDITYYVYKARRLPKSVLCSHVRRKWVPHEYPSNMQRMYAWTPDECIPEFYTDPDIFTSIHDDMAHLEIPSWTSSAEDFISTHMKMLESDAVSCRLHRWIDLTFGFKLTGNAAIQAKNVCLQLVDNHQCLLNYGVVQLFTDPHPPRSTSVLRSNTTIASKVEKSPRNANEAKVGRKRSERAAIVLPKGYEPLKALDQLEALYEFSLATNKKLPPLSNPKNPVADKVNCLLIRDMKSLGCILAQLFLPGRMRIVCDETGLTERYSVAKAVCKAHINDIPRLLWPTVFKLFGIEESWHMDSSSSSSVRNYENDLISPQSIVDAIPFPSHFSTVYQLICKLRTLDADNSSSKSTGRQQVSLLASHLHYEPHGVHLLIPYICDLLQRPVTAAMAACQLSGPVCRHLGPLQSSRVLLPLLLHLYSADLPPSPHILQIHHRSFILMLLIRLGMSVVLHHFITPLVEACAGFKNLATVQLTQHLLEPLDDSDMDMSVFADDVELREAASDDANTQSSEGSADCWNGDRISLTSTQEQQTLEIGGPALEQSITSKSQDNISQKSVCLESRTEDSDSNGQEKVTPIDLADDMLPSLADTVTMSSMVRSETEEFRSNLISANVSDVAAETIKWLAHRLGPLLTARCLARRLLQMLTLCYHGDEQLAPVQHEGAVPSTTNQHVAGDIHATHVLDCLSCITILYGEQVVLLQFIPHIKDMISCALSKLTSRVEAALIGCASLIIHVVPYLSDTTLMDILQESILKEMLLPLLKLASSQHISFPSASRSRSIICLKIIDTIYVLGLRIGFEMTREHMTFVLQKFFAAFNRVYDTDKDTTSAEDELANISNESAISQTQQTDTSKSSSDDSLYFEIKMDAQTNEYHIGTPISTASFLSEPVTPHSNTAPVVDDIDISPTESTRDEIMEELKQTFCPALAHAAYIPFCKLAGGIHMEQNLINDDLIRTLCASHDDEISRRDNIASQQQHASQQTNTSALSDFSLESLSSSMHEGKKFGSSGAAGGNRMTVREDDVPQVDALMCRTRSRSGEPPIDYNKLHSPEMEVNKHRHLRGNWLAYWEHELGHGGRHTEFDFKQIQLQTFTGHSAGIKSLCVLDNENSFLSASKDKTVKLWSLRSFGEGLGRQSCQWTYREHKKSVFTVDFLETPHLAVSCDNSVHVWDPFLGSCVTQYESPKNSLVTVLTPMPAPSHCLATATTDALVRFIDVRCEALTHHFKCSISPSGLIRCVGVSPDGSWLAVGHSSGLICVLDVRTGLLLSSWKAHDSEILQMKVYNSKSLLTTSFEQVMTLWNVDDGKAICHFKGLSEPVNCVQFYRDKLLSASTANRVGVHSSLNSLATYCSTKLRSDSLRGVLTMMAVLPQNCLLLLGADNGLIKLMA